MTAERCEQCDHIIATREDYAACGHEGSGCDCDKCRAMCWRDYSGGVCVLPAPSSPGASELSEALPVDTCRVCGVPRVFTNGHYMDHHAPCGRMCRTADGYPGQVHPDHCDCSSPEAIRLGADPRRTK